MPTYEVTGPDGRTLSIDGPTPPSETELDQIFAAVKSPASNNAAPTAKVGLMASTRDRLITQLGLPPTASLNDILSAAQVKERQRTSEGAGLMPTVGGAIGGLVGGIPGAALGGGVGEAVRQAVLRGNQDTAQVPPTASGQATAMAKEAGLQGAFQGAGQAVAAGGGALSKWLMNRATTRVTAKLMRDFPDLSDTLIENALTVSQGGYEKAAQMLTAAKAQANAALATATNAGASIPVKLTPEIADSLRTSVIEQAVKSGKVGVRANAPLSVATERLDPATQGFLGSIDQAAKTGGTVDLTPVQADAFKRQLQKESRALYANYTAPNGQRAMPAEATLKAEFASRVNDAIDAVAGGYKAGNAAAQPLIGAVRGIQQAIRPNGNLMQAMVRPGIGAALGYEAGKTRGQGATGAIVGALATSPANLSREAIVLANPAVKQLLQQLPRGLAAAIRAHLTGAEAGVPIGTPIQPAGQ